MQCLFVSVWHQIRILGKAILSMSNLKTKRAGWGGGGQNLKKKGGLSNQQYRKWASS